MIFITTRKHPLHPFMKKAGNSGEALRNSSLGFKPKNSSLAGPFLPADGALGIHPPLPPLVEVISTVMKLQI